MLDTDSKDLVAVHTDGNEQLSVMRYGPGMLINADSMFALSMQSDGHTATSNNNLNF